MKVLTVKHPWAYLICSGIKDIENRTWKLPEKYRGERVLIHTSAKPDARFNPLEKEFFMMKQWEGIPRKFKKVIMEERLPVSAIIGSVRFVDCMINHESIWAEETSFPNQLSDNCIYNWVAEDPVLFDKPILNVKGRLRFWEYDLPEEYLKLLK